jgi:hypothetical protein
MLCDATTSAAMLQLHAKLGGELTIGCEFSVFSHS